MGVRAPGSGETSRAVTGTGQGVVVTEECFRATPIPVPTPVPVPSGERVTALKQTTPQTEDVLIDFPNTKNGQWQSFTVRVVNGFHVFRGAAFGWTITMVRLPVPRPDAVVLPETVPAVAPVSSEGAAVASVTLPEAAGYTQYWVPVLERYKTAVLQAREWTVVFQKQANTYQVSEQ